jgi:hypothetical protein
MATLAFFSAVYRTFYKIDYILGYIDSLKKYMKIEIIPFVFQTIRKYN